MKKTTFLLIAFFLATINAMADSGEYAVSAIPAILLKNADAVLRMEELRFEVINTREAVKNYHYVITILNENGDKWSEFADYYDKLREISSVQGYLYDAAGKELKKMKTKDLEDLSGIDETSLMNDNRIKRHNFYCKTYPYTIEYNVEIRYRHTLFFPDWVPQGGEKLSVERSRVIIICPEDYKFRYKAFNYTGEPVITHENKRRVSTWAVTNVPAIIKEIYQPPLKEITTAVIFAPTEFQIGDYKGNMQSWQDFGKFIYALKEGRDILPPEIKSKVHELTDTISDVKRKISVLYQYLQKNTRYISIQLGIGGWQPFDAAFVASRSYGDCKALSNYMYSMLKEAGIKSDYTVIHSGDNAMDIVEDFPSQQFDHVILCVPLKKDTVWLECTSQTLPAGYLGGFTANRYALAVDENGGTLVHTPLYGLEDNLQVKKIKAVLSGDATLSVNVQSVYSAMQQDNLHMLIHGLSKEKLKEYLHDELDFGTYDISNFSYAEHKSSLPAIDESLDIEVSNYATITGKRIFVSPDIMTRSHTKFPADTGRKYDIQSGFEYREIDSAEIEIPKGYRPEAMPQDVSVVSKFGKYNCSVRLENTKLLYSRSFEHYSGRFPAKDYGELVRFYETVYKADRNRVVLVKNGASIDSN